MSDAGRPDRLVVLRAPDGGVVSVARGFSWPALLLGPFWFAAKRAWRLFVGLLVANIVLAVLGEVMLERTLDLTTAFVVQLVYLAFVVWCGARGNAWLVAAYERQGYRRIEAARSGRR